MVDWLQHFIDAIIRFTADNPALTGLLLLFFAGAEAVIVVGALVPGEAAVLALATAAGAAGMNPWQMLAWVTLGAVLGDGVSFWIGRRYGNGVLRWPLVRAHPELLDKAEAFIRRQGVKAVIIGRFLPGLRAIMPVAAGVLGMPPGRFYVANVLSALAWAAVHVFPAVLLGEAYNQLGVVSGRLTALLALLLLSLFLLVWLARAMFVWVAPRLEALQLHLAAWLNARPDAFSRRLARWLTPEMGGLGGMLFWGGLFMLGAGGLIAVMEDLLTGDPLVRADVAIHRFLQSLRTEPADAVMVTITALGDGIVIAAAAAALIGTLLWQRAWRLALAAGTTIAATAVLVPIMKLLLHKPRPITIYRGAEAFSFPSGHTAMTAVVFGIAAVLAARRLSFGMRLAVFGLYALWVGLVGFSRIYLAAHWPSDVLGGLFMGLALVAAFALWLDLSEEAESPRSWRQTLMAPLAAVLALMVVGSFHVPGQFQRNLVRYAPRQEQILLPLNAWLNGGWRSLPQRRIDLKGEFKEPLLLQWGDKPDTIRGLLGQGGWRAHALPTFRDALIFLLTNVALADLPPLPLLHEGRLPVMMFIQPLPGGESRLVLRFWRSGVRVRTQAGVRPLFLGALTEERVKHVWLLGTVLRERPIETLPNMLKTAVRKAARLSVTETDAGIILIHPRAQKSRP